MTRFKTHGGQHGTIVSENITARQRISLEVLITPEVLRETRQETAEQSGKRGIVVVTDNIKFKCNESRYYESRF
jgi:hypothetical protein